MEKGVNGLNYGHRPEHIPGGGKHAGQVGGIGLAEQHIKEQLQETLDTVDDIVEQVSGINTQHLGDLLQAQHQRVLGQRGDQIAQPGQDGLRGQVAVEVAEDDPKQVVDEVLESVDGLRQVGVAKAHPFEAGDKDVLAQLIPEL